MARPGYPHPTNLKGFPTPAWRAEPRYEQPSRCGTCVTAPEQHETSWNRRLSLYNNVPRADSSGERGRKHLLHQPAPSTSSCPRLWHFPPTILAHGVLTLRARLSPKHQEGHRGWS